MNLKHSFAEIKTNRERQPFYQCLMTDRWLGFGYVGALKPLGCVKAVKQNNHGLHDLCGISLKG